MLRREGSGFARGTATAVEKLTAAVFRGDVDLSSYMRQIEHEVDRGRTTIRGSDIERWLHAIADQLALDVVIAESPSPDHLGDVRLTLVDGSHIWIEVKAPTTKRFADLVQSDWVRDQTDALRWLALNEPALRSHLSPWILEELSIYDEDWQFGGFNFVHLFLADIALLPDRARRASAGIATIEDLVQFLERKYLLHVTAEGARLLRLDRLATVQDILDGQTVHLDIESGGACDARVWVSTGSLPRRGSMDFIYYVGYHSGVVGRHRLHPSSVARSEGLITAR